MAKNKKTSSLKASLEIDENIYESAEKNRGGGGKSFARAFDWTKQDGMDIDKDSFFRPEPKKTYQFNIIPWVMKSENNPLIYKSKGKIPVGKTHYMLEVFIHNNVGPDEAPIVCLKHNYGKACPVCDAYEELAAQAEDDKAKKAADQIKAKRRAYMNIQLVEDGEPSDEVLLWNAGFFRFMTEGILEEANACREGGAPVAFAHPTKGKLIKIRTSHSSFSKKDVTVAKCDFEDREEEIEDDIFEQAVSFDECMVVYTAEQLEAILEGEEVSLDDDEEDIESEVEDTEDDTEDTETEDDSEDTEDLDSEEEEEEEEEEAPPKKSARKRESKKPEKKAAKKKPKKCPYGLTFGEDYDSCEDCDNCMTENEDIYKECLEASDEE